MAWGILITMVTLFAMMGLAMFEADQRFPNSDMPHQASGMWEGDRSLTASGWSMYGGSF